LPINGNTTAIPIHAVQSLDLVLFWRETCDQHRRKKTGRQQPAAVNANNLLKKKESSMTSPNAINILQKPRVYGLNAISNHCTIAHITVLSIGLTAAKLGQTDKVRFVKTFLPNL
jgi:hypothetical protein